MKYHETTWNNIIKVRWTDIKIISWKKTNPEAVTSIPHRRNIDRRKWRHAPCLWAHHSLYTGHDLRQRRLNPIEISLKLGKCTILNPREKKKKKKKQQGDPWCNCRPCLRMGNKCITVSINKPQGKCTGPRFCHLQVKAPNMNVSNEKKRKSLLVNCQWTWYSAANHGNQKWSEDVWNGLKLCEFSCLRRSEACLCVMFEVLYQTKQCEKEPISFLSWLKSTLWCNQSNTFVGISPRSWFHRPWHVNKNIPSSPSKDAVTHDAAPQEIWENFLRVLSHAV